MPPSNAALGVGHGPGLHVPRDDEDHSQRQLDDGHDGTTSTPASPTVLDDAAAVQRRDLRGQLDARQLPAATSATQTYTGTGRGASTSAATHGSAATTPSDLTIAADNDVIIERRRDSRHRHDGVLLGLIANNFVRVYHPVDCGHDGGPGDCAATPAMDRPQPRLDAAILALEPLVHRRQLVLRRAARRPQRLRRDRPAASAARSVPAAHRSARATARTTSTTTGCATASRRTSWTRCRPPGASPARPSRCRHQP